MSSNWTGSYMYDTTGRPFFTYFSEFRSEKELTSYASWEAAVAIFVSYFSLIANVPVIIFMIRLPDLRSATNYFLLNLVVAGLSFTATMPFVIYTRTVQSWTFGESTCKLVPFVQCTSAIVQLWTLVCICLKRRSSLVHGSSSPPVYAFYISLVLWTVASLAVLPVTVWFRLVRSVDGTKTICSLDFPMPEVPVLIAIGFVFFAGLLPLVLLVVYCKETCEIIYGAMNTARGGGTFNLCRITLSTIYVPLPRDWSRNDLLRHEPLWRFSNSPKVVGAMIFGVLTAIVLWLPLIVSVVLIAVDGRRENNSYYFFRSHYFFAALVIAQSSTVINPLLYGILTDHFQRRISENWPQTRVFTGRNGRKFGKENSSSRRVNAETAL